MLLSPETSIEGATLLAERIRASVREQPISDGDRAPIRITVSVGIACFPQAEVATPEDLIREADLALLEAKRLGRDRVFVSLGARPR